MFYFRQIFRKQHIPYHLKRIQIHYVFLSFYIYQVQTICLLEHVLYHHWCLSKMCRLEFFHIFTGPRCHFFSINGIILVLFLSMLSD